MSEALDDTTWIDDQTREGKPAVLMVYDPEADYGHLYVVNAPAFDMPVVLIQDVPRHAMLAVRGHLSFLHGRHIDGHPIENGQVTALDGFGRLYLRTPGPEERAALMDDELTQAALRWPDATVLVLVPLFPTYGAKPCYH